jgi:hypothetical protein
VSVLEHLDVLEVAIDQLARFRRVLSEAIRERARKVGLALLMALLFVLHWVAFSVRTSLGLVDYSLASSLAVGAVIWLVMLAPALHASVKRRDAAKARAQSARRNRESRPQETSHPDLLRMSVDQFEGSTSWLAYFGAIAEHACSLLFAPGTARLRLVQLAEVAVRMHETPQLWVARLIRHLFYAGCYVGSTMYTYERTEEGEWLFETVPAFFYFVNFVSLWTNYFDYMTDLAMGGWSYFFSLDSLLQLTTMPPFILATSILVSGLRSVPVTSPHLGATVRTVGETWNLDGISPDPLQYLIQFGFLRFLAATQVNNVALKRLRVRSTRLRVASLILTVACIIFVIGGGMFLLEAQLNGDDHFVNYGDFLYCPSPRAPGLYLISARSPADRTRRAIRSRDADARPARACALAAGALRRYSRRRDCLDGRIRRLYPAGTIVSDHGRGGNHDHNHHDSRPGEQAAGGHGRGARIDGHAAASGRALHPPLRPCLAVATHCLCVQRRGGP